MSLATIHSAYVGYGCRLRLGELLTLIASGPYSPLYAMLLGWYRERNELANRSVSNEILDREATLPEFIDKTMKGTTRMDSSLKRLVDVLTSARHPYDMRRLTLEKGDKIHKFHIILDNSDMQHLTFVVGYFVGFVSSGVESSKSKIESQFPEALLDDEQKADLAALSTSVANKEIVVGIYREKKEIY